jgi:hypothetical protein
VIVARACGRSVAYIVADIVNIDFVIIDICLAKERVVGSYISVVCNFGA